MSEYALYRFTSRLLIICAPFLFAGTGFSQTMVDQKPMCDGVPQTRMALSFENGITLQQRSDGRNALFSGETIEAIVGERGTNPFWLNIPEIQYAGGYENERIAHIVDDPTGRNNRVLQYVLSRPNVRDAEGTPYKGRIQMNVYNNVGIQRVAMNTRMFLSEDFAYLYDYPGAIGWLTISEWWNNGDWTDEGYPFRITVDVVKEASGPQTRLVFGIRTEVSENGVWKRILTARNTDFAVPIAKWMTLEYEFIEGDANHGRFVMAVTAEGGERTVLFDFHGYTHHPDDPQPDGLAYWNPVKLYTSKEVINYMQSRGGALGIAWDDIDVVACRASESQPSGQPEPIADQPVQQEPEQPDTGDVQPPPQVPEQPVTGDTPPAHPAPEQPDTGGAQPPPQAPEQPVAGSPTPAHSESGQPGTGSAQPAHQEPAQPVAGSTPPARQEPGQPHAGSAQSTPHEPAQSSNGNARPTPAQSAQSNQGTDQFGRATASSGPGGPPQAPRASSQSRLGIQGTSGIGSTQASNTSGTGRVTGAGLALQRPSAPAAPTAEVATTTVRPRPQYFQCNPNSWSDGTSREDVDACENPVAYRMW